MERSHVWALASLVAVAAAMSLGIPASVSAGDAAFVRVAILPLGDRSSIVVELSGRVERVEDVSATSDAIDIEAGPLVGAPRAMDFVPTGDSAFVSRVALTSVSRIEGTFLQVHVALRAEMAHRLRTAGSRIYIDLTSGDSDMVARTGPPPAPVVAPVPVSRSERGSETTRRDETPSAPAALPAAPEKPSSNKDEDAESAYRMLESTILRKAKDLSAKPDVRALLRLSDEVQKRDVELGQKRPAVVEHVRIELQRMTEAAQALQLQKDRELLLQAAK
jgi:hypothetical protein